MHQNNAAVNLWSLRNWWTPDRYRQWSNTGPVTVFMSFYHWAVLQPMDWNHACTCYLGNCHMSGLVLLGLLFSSISVSFVLRMLLDISSQIIIICMTITTHDWEWLKKQLSIYLGKLWYSLTWIKAIKGDDFPYSPIFPVRLQWGRYNLSRYVRYVIWVIVIYIYIYTYIIPPLNTYIPIYTHIT